MKRFSTLTLIVLIFCQSTGTAQSIVHFRISKPLCLLTFLEAANKQWDASRTYSAYIYKHVPAASREDFYRMVDRFASINMSTYRPSDDLPAARQKTKSVYNIIKGTAVRSKYTEKFLHNSIGIMPDDQLQKLRDVMYWAEPYYNDMIWKEYKDDAERQLKELEKYTGKVDIIFGKLKNFYGSSWPANTSFEIGIYPIPGEHGHTTATPHGNNLVLAVLTGERNYAMRIGVAVHEMCHVLYDRQPFRTQWREDSAFAAQRSGYAKYAYTYFDEALATACGNGWAYEYLTGHTEKGNWYDNTYINNYAKAIYPMVKSYIHRHKRIDEAFIKNAIDQFKKKFPDAVSDYDNLLNRVSLYTDAANMDEMHWINKTLRKYYNITSCSSSFPIADNQTLNLVKRSPGTQLFIIHHNHSEDFALLRQIFPELRKVHADRESLISFTDRKKRPVIILNVDGIDRVNNGLRKMVQQKNMNSEDMVSKID